MPPLRDAHGVPAELEGISAQDLLEGTPDAMVIVDEAGRIVLVNGNTERLLGYSREELVGNNVDVLVPDAVRPGHAALRGQFMAHPKARPMGANIDLRARHKDGREIPVEISLSPLRTAHGNLVTAAIRDVTDRRRAEQKFRGLLEAAPDAMIIVDAKGQIVLANAQAERLFGYPRAELVGATVDKLVPDTVRPVHGVHRDRFMGDPKARPMGAALDLRARRKDGSELPVEISLSPLDIAGERLVTAAIRDITDRRRLEKERQQGRDRERELEHLRQVDLFKTTFLNTAAHELRTPLLPVKSELYMLKRRLASNADAGVNSSLVLLERNIRRLAGLVEDLLDAARYQAGRVVLKLEDADVHALARDAVDSFRQAADDHRIQVHLALEGPPTARVDAGRVGQVLYNLLGNAVKFTPDGGRIDVEVRNGPDGLAMKVTDTGFGLAKEELERLFQPFVQLRQAVEPGQRGSGLGLYISRGFIEAHGGRIWAESQGPDRGSTFAFALPVSPEQSPAAERSPPPTRL